MKKIIFFFLCFFAYAYAQTRPLADLKNVADGLNIEGGSVCDYLKEGKIWANLCVILDRPFADGIEWQTITDTNPFPLKEASLSDYNETQVNLAYALFLKYYIEQAHSIVKKPKTQPVKILLQVHRNTSGPHHLSLLRELVDLIDPKQENVELIFSYGTRPEHLAKEGKYDQADIVLSFSLVAGLHPQWPSGSLLIPKEHIPFSLKTLALEIDKKYLSRNHLLRALPEVIAQQNDNLIAQINARFPSKNPEKKGLRAKRLRSEDFKEATLLQVDDMFNPSRLPSQFSIIDSKNDD